MQRQNEPKFLLSAEDEKIMRKLYPFDERKGFFDTQAMYIHVSATDEEKRRARQIADNYRKWAKRISKYGQRTGA